MIYINSSAISLKCYGASSSDNFKNPLNSLNIENKKCSSDFVLWKH